MGYSRAYPQNIAPKGTNIQQGFENDDKEFKRIYDILSNNGSFTLAGSKRQSILYGPTDANGSPNFLAVSGLSISIDGSAKPIILAFANGFSPSSGTVDALDKIDAAVSNAWTLPANSTCYLYVDKDVATGLLSYGYTTLPDQYLKAAPTSPVLNQHYFNTVEMKMYCYNGTSWDVKQRVFVGKAVTSSTINLSIYDFGSRFFSKVNSAIDSAGAIRCGNSVEIKSSNGVLTLTDDSNLFVVDRSVVQNNVQPITSASGVLTLTTAGSSFYAYGAENLTSIAGWSSGTAVIQWGSDRTLVHSAGLSLLGAINRSVKSGSFSIFTMSAAGAVEVRYYSQENITSMAGWSSGIAAIRFNTVRTLVNSSSLVLQDGMNRMVQIGDVGLYAMDNGVVREISYFPAAKAKSGLPGTGDYIASGRKIASTNGLNVSLTAGECFIGGKTVSMAQNTITLPPRKACLIVDKSDGTSDYVVAKYPTDYIDDNTVGFWAFNKAAGETVPNLAVGKSAIAVVNDLVPVGGITAVDGWCDSASRLNGTNSYFKGSNTTNFPSGSTAAFEIALLYTIDTLPVADNRRLFFMGSYPSACVDCYIKLSDKSIAFDVNGTEYNSKYVLTAWETPKITLSSNGTIVTFKINGAKVLTVTTPTPITLSYGLFVGASYDGTFESAITCHYIELRNAPRSDDKTAEIANKMLLPCWYTDVNNKRRSIIDDVVPENSVAVAYVRTSSTAVLEYNDSWPKYGRYEKATGGNRKMFLGWLPFSGATYLKWSNPFGTGKYKKEFHWSRDSKGTNEVTANTRFNDSSGNTFGVGPITGTAGYNDAQNITALVGASGATNFGGSWQTSGYIGCYAEMLEDYEGVV